MCRERELWQLDRHHDNGSHSLSLSLSLSPTPLLLHVCVWYVHDLLGSGWSHAEGHMDEKSHILPSRPPRTRKMGGRGALNQFALPNRVEGCGALSLFLSPSSILRGEGEGLSIILWMSDQVCRKKGGKKKGFSSSSNSLSPARFLGRMFWKMLPDEKEREKTLGKALFHFFFFFSWGPFVSFS